MKLKHIQSTLPVIFFFFLITIQSPDNSEEGLEVARVLDVFLAIDQSGSMEFTDPYGVRINSAKI